MNRIILVTQCMITSLIFSSCGFYVSKQNASTVAPPPDAQKILASIPSYADVNQYVFSVSCVSCHHSGNASGNVLLDTYTNVVANLSRAQSAIVSGVMPPNQTMSSFQTQLLSNWISNGAPEFSSNPITTPTPSPGGSPSPTPDNSTQIVATYQSIHDQIFVPMCLSCHTQGGRASNILLEPYSALVAQTRVVKPGNAAGSQLYTATNSGSMPPSDTLTNDQITAIKNWINAGALQ